MTSGDRGSGERGRHGRTRGPGLITGGHSVASGAGGWVVIAVVAVLAGGLASLGPSDASCPPVQLIAHRGIAPVESENTHQAFRAARQLGFRLIETDARITADGAFVLMHDQTLRRTTARPERVADLRLSSLRETRTRGGNRIPTLGGVLRWAHANDVGVLLELKHDPRRPWRQPHLSRLLRTVDRLHMTDEVTFVSFRRSDMRAIERLDSSRRTGWIPQAPPTLAEATGTVDKVFLPRSMVSAPLVRRMHQAGVQVSGRTTQRLDDLQVLARAGVVEVITDELDPRSARGRTRGLRTCVTPAGGWR